MIPFSDLQKQADLVAEKMGLYTTVAVTYLRYKSAKPELRYEFYQSGFSSTRYYETAQGLMMAMDAILAEEDEGVSLESEAA